MAKKFGLGKGLGALIPEEIKIAKNESEVKDNIIMADIFKIKPNKEQPRRFFDDNKIVELSQSIKEHGIIQPLVVQKDIDDTYKIIAGERRWRAARIAEIKELPIIVRNLTETELLQVSLIENIQRENLNAIEEALAFKKLIKEFDFTQEKLALKIGKSRVTITNTMRLLNLDYRVQEYIIQGVISEGHGRTLLALKNEEQYKMAQRIIDDKLSVREAEKIIKSLLNNEKKETVKKENYVNNIYYKDIKDKLQDYFGTKVTINNNKNKGKIEIEYYSEEDLERILDIINV